jgi:transcriptional regulator with XRE-family HTH domain
VNNSTGHSPDELAASVTDPGDGYRARPPSTALVGLTVKRLRGDRGWSAAELAERLTAAGVPTSRTTVSDIETGRRSFVTLDELLALARVLEVEFDTIVSQVIDAHPTPVLQVVAYQLGRVADLLERIAPGET